MIAIKYNFQKLDVKIDGHEDESKKGEAIFCAGVSALTMALAIALKDAKEQGLVKKLTLDIEDGHSHIKAVPNEGCEVIVQTIFRTIFNGYDAMGVSYPEMVSFKSAV